MRRSEFDPISHALGGRAFPTNPQSQCDGMGLLDWFAGQAVMGFLANDFSREGAVNAAYSVAELMMKRRQEIIDAAKAKCTDPE